MTINSFTIYLSQNQEVCIATANRDKTMADEYAIELPLHSVLRQDLGFVGHRPVGILIEEPFKNRTADAA